MKIPFRYQKDHKCCQAEKRLDFLSPQRVSCITAGGRSYMATDLSVLHKENFLVNSCMALQSNQIPAGCPPVRDAPGEIPVWDRGNGRWDFQGSFLIQEPRMAK